MLIRPGVHPVPMPRIGRLTKTSGMSGTRVQPPSFFQHGKTSLGLAVGVASGLALGVGLPLWASSLGTWDGIKDVPTLVGTALFGGISLGIAVDTAEELIFRVKGPLYAGLNIFSLVPLVPLSVLFGWILMK